MTARGNAPSMLHALLPHCSKHAPSIASSMRQALLEQCSTMPNHSQIHIHSPQSPSQLFFVRKLCSSNNLHDGLKLFGFPLISIRANFTPFLTRLKHCMANADS